MMAVSLTGAALSPGFWTPFVMMFTAGIGFSAVRGNLRKCPAE
ncbi:hypothetical protein [Methanogenium sp. MK-MG]|nr:hypothetical protein [Methanogenium sp. MK-MG]